MNAILYPYISIINMGVIYMSEKRILPDTLIHKILSKYGDYNYLPIFDTSTEVPINTNTYDKKDKSGSIHIEPIEDNKNIPLSILNPDKTTYRLDYWSFTPDGTDVYFSHTLNADGSKETNFKCLPENKKAYKHPSKTQLLERKINQLNTENHEKDIKIQQLEARLSFYEQQKPNIIPAETIKSTLNESQKQSVEIFTKNIEQDRQDKISKRKPAGRPNKLTESEIQIIYELNQKGYSLREIASQMNCSKSTVDNYLKKAKRRGIPE